VALPGARAARRFGDHLARVAGKGWVPPELLTQGGLVDRLLRGEVLAPAPPNEQKAIPRIADPAVGRAALAGLRAAMGGARA